MATHRNRKRRIADCHPEKLHYARGMCKPCYSRWLADRDRKPPREKRVPECHPDRPYFARNMCHECYWKWYHAQNRDRLILYGRSYCATHKSESRDYYLKNKDHIDAARRIRDKEHPEKKIILEDRRRAMEIGAIGEFTPEEWIALCEKYSLHCLGCGLIKPLTIDHIVPLSLGGTGYIENIQPLCKSCNSRKRTKIIDYRPIWDNRLSEIGIGLSYPR